MTLLLDAFPDAHAGQFIQLHPRAGDGPLLPRAFSISGLKRLNMSAEIELVYHVGGAGTQWMASLDGGDHATVLGPLGRAFTLPDFAGRAALVIGGVGLPPLKWFAESLHHASIGTTAFVGARSADVMLIRLHDRAAPDPGAREAVHCCDAFDPADVPLIVSTDDGSCGFRGNIVDALRAYYDARADVAAGLTIYTCGPEPMLRAVAAYCAEREIACQVCMERAMACGIGSCQSCVIPVRADECANGWRYALCCQDGPVFDARNVLWDEPG